MGDIVDAEQGPIERVKASPEDRMKDARVHFIDAAHDYQLGLASARDLAAETVRVVDIQAPIVMDASFAGFTAEIILARSVDGQATVNFQLAGSRLDIEVGDSLSLPGQDGLWRVEVLDGLNDAVGYGSPGRGGHLAAALWLNAGRNGSAKLDSQACDLHAGYSGRQRRAISRAQDYHRSA